MSAGSDIRARTARRSVGGTSEEEAAEGQEENRKVIASRIHALPLALLS
jgi:hypothetical protein